jgi:hypothetical protein
MPWAAALPFFSHAAKHSGHVPMMTAMDETQ